MLKCPMLCQPACEDRRVRSVSACMCVCVCVQVVAWGRNDFGQTNVPASLTSATINAMVRNAARSASDQRTYDWLCVSIDPY